LQRVERIPTGRLVLPSRRVQQTDIETTSRRRIMTEQTTNTLGVPGALLTYDVRSNTASTEPVLLIIGSPTAAAGFGTLAAHLSDRTVATYDPRRVERS